MVWCMFLCARVYMCICEFVDVVGEVRVCSQVLLSVINVERDTSVICVYAYTFLTMSAQWFCVCVSLWFSPSSPLSFSLYLSLYVPFSFSFSLSPIPHTLSIYVYVCKYIYIYTRTHKYIHVYVWLSVCRSACLSILLCAHACAVLSGRISDARHIASAAYRN